MNKFLYILILFSFNTNAQNFNLYKDFNYASLKGFIEYYHENTTEIPITDIQTKEFKELKDPFPGLTGASFWFKTTLTNNNANKKYLLNINALCIDSLTIFKKQKTKLNVVYTNYNSSQKHLNIPILLNTETSTYFFKVRFSKSVYFPIDITSIKQSSFINNMKLVQNGLYYGFVLFVIVINMAFYFSTKKKHFLFYCLLLISISFNLLDLDDFFYYLFGNAFIVNYLDLIFNFFLILFIHYFTSEVLELKKHFPKFKKILLPFIILNGVSYILYIYSNLLIWYSIGATVNALLLLSYLASSILLYKKQVYARFITYGYTILVIADVLFILPSEFGSYDVGFSSGYIKIASIIEMLVFLYALVYQYKTLEKQKIEVEKQYNSFAIEANKEKTKLTEQIEDNNQNKFSDYVAKHKISKREAEIAKAILEGKSNEQIANELDIKLTTVKYHNSNLFVKLNIKRRTELSAHYNSTKN